MTDRRTFIKRMAGAGAHYRGRPVLTNLQRIRRGRKLPLSRPRSSVCLTAPASRAGQGMCIFLYAKGPALMGRKKKAVPWGGFRGYYII